MHPNDSVFWIYTDDDKVHFSNLVSGNYHFQVQARNSHNNWCKIESFKFTVDKAFNETVFYQLILILSPFIAILVFYLLYYLFFRGFVVRAGKYDRLLKKFKKLKLSGLNAQMNSHFVFNAMNSIQSFIITQDFNQGNLFMKSFGGILRQTLNMNRKLWVTLDDEVNLIRDYLVLENGSQGDHFSFQINAELNKQQLNIRIPPLFIQPLVENCIKHAFTTKSTANFIEVVIEVKKHNSKFSIVVIKVQDNGQGIQESNTKSDSLGIKILEDKIFLLNEKFETNVGYLSISNRIDESGVLSFVQIPVDLEDDSSEYINWRESE